MTVFLRQSTARDIRVGPFVDVGDGFTPETGVTIAASDEAEILKHDGAATVAMAGAFGAVTGADGWYDYTLSATDTDTVGELVIVMQDDSVYLPVFVRAYVVEEEVYDDLFAASATGYLKPVTAGRDLDVTATGAAGIDWGNVENPTTAVDLSGTDIQLVDTATAVTNDVGITAGAVDNIWNEAASGHTTLGTFGQMMNGLGARTGAVNDAGAAAGDFDVDGFTEATNDHFNGMVMTFTSGALAGQSRTITDYVGASQNCVFAEVWTEAPANNDEFIITPAILAGTTLATVLRLFVTILDQSTGQIDAGSFAAGAIDAAAIATGAIDADSIATDAITAAKIAANAIGSSELATDAIGAAQIAAAAITASEAPNLDAAISTRATPAQVNTEVSDVMKTDTITLPGQVAPPLTPTFEEALSWLYKVLRNRKRQTSTDWELMDDAETTVDAKATVSDDGTTAIKQEIVAGP